MADENPKSNFLTPEEAKDATKFNARLFECNRLYALQLFTNRRCMACDTKEDNEHELYACTGCSGTFFCNKKCQQEAWSKHKETCPRHDKIGLNGIRFVPPIYGLFSLQHHPLFRQATEIIETEDGYPMAIHKVDPGEDGKTFGQHLRAIVGNMVIADSSLYAQLVLLAKYWHVANDRFCIYTSNKPVGSQMDTFKIANSTAQMLLPTNPQILEMLAKTGQDSPLDIFQGPRPLDLVQAKKSIYRGMTRYRGPIAGTPRVFSQVCTAELAYWVKTVKTSERPMTFGTETTWEINKSMVETLQQAMGEEITWRIHDPPRPSDEQEQEVPPPTDEPVPEEPPQDDFGRDIADFANYFKLMDQLGVCDE